MLLGLVWLVVSGFSEAFLLVIWLVGWGFWLSLFKVVSGFQNTLRD